MKNIHRFCLQTVVDFKFKFFSFFSQSYKIIKKKITIENKFALLKIHNFKNYLFICVLHLMRENISLMSKSMANFGRWESPLFDEEVAMTIPLSFRFPPAS